MNHNSIPFLSVIAQFLFIEFLYCDQKYHLALHIMVFCLSIKRKVVRIFSITLDENVYNCCTQLKIFLTTNLYNQ